MTQQAQTDPSSALASARLGRRGHPGPRPARVALTRQEAADALGMSIDHFERHVQGELRVIRSGRLILVPVSEVERWADHNAERALTP